MQYTTSYALVFLKSDVDHVDCSRDSLINTIKRGITYLIQKKAKNQILAVEKRKGLAHLTAP